MNTAAGDPEQNRVADRNWVKRIFVPVLGLLLVIAITVGLFYYYRSYPGRIEELKTYGYLGAFVISIIFNATIILPAGNMLILVALGATMPSPVLVGIVGAAGAAIGEITGYVAGASGRRLISRGRLYGRIEGWVTRWGSLSIFVISMVPFVFDVVGIVAGASRFSFWRFLLFCWFGRTVLYIVIITLAVLGLRVVLPWLG